MDSGLKSCGLPILTGNVFAIAMGVNTIVTATIVDNIINTKNIGIMDLVRLFMDGSIFLDWHCIP